MQPQIAEPPVLPGELAQACPQLGVVASPRPIPDDRAGEADQPAGPPLAATVGLDQVPQSPPPSRAGHQ
jgi:hypothetical protein